MKLNQPKYALEIGNNPVAYHTFSDERTSSFFSFDLIVGENILHSLACNFNSLIVQIIPMNIGIVLSAFTLSSLVGRGCKGMIEHNCWTRP